MRKLICLACILSCYWLSATAQTPNGWDTLTGPTLFQYFAQQADPPTLRLQTDWKKLIWRKRKEEYLAGQMQFEHRDAQAIELPVRLRARGNMRKEVCHYPPLKVKLKKKALAKLGFAKLNDLKMVVQCGKGGRGEQYLFREYLMYKIHDILSEHTYATQLVRLELVEEDGEMTPLYGFLIEDEDDFAYRYRGRLVTTGRIRKNLLHREAYINMCFFQYMIQNHDWSIDNKHNVEFLLPKDSTQLITVPYDFDYAGLVGTSYAVPDPQLGIESVFEFHFRGKGFSAAEVEKAALHILDKREAIIAYIDNYTWLAANERSKLIRHFNRVFDLLENERKRNREFIRRG